MKSTRWQQRFENFERALTLLRTTFQEKKIDQFSDLEKEGIVQRFEYTFELGWKTLKDYLEYMGSKLEQITPRYIIKQAFAANIITDGHVWIDMIEHRNLMSHTYNPETFKKAVTAIVDSYLPAFEKLYSFLKSKDT